MNQKLQALKELKELKDLKELVDKEDEEDDNELNKIQKIRHELQSYQILNELRKFRRLEGLQGLKELKGHGGLKLVRRAASLKRQNKISELNNLKNYIELDLINETLVQKKLDTVKDIKELKKMRNELERIENLKIKRDLNEELAGIVEDKNSQNNSEWLRWLHQRYSERFLNDNNRIWTVTSIFIPLSLAGLSSVKEGTFINTFLLAIGSISLVIFWHLICEKHRFFQDESLDIVREIEKYIGVDVSKLKNKKGEPNSIEKGKEYTFKNWLRWNFHNKFNWKLYNVIRNTSIKQSRKYMVWIVSFVWILAIILVTDMNVGESGRPPRTLVIIIKDYLTEVINYLFKHKNGPYLR